MTSSEEENIGFKQTTKMTDPDEVEERSPSTTILTSPTESSDGSVLITLQVPTRIQKLSKQTGISSSFTLVVLAVIFFLVGMLGPKVFLTAGDVDKIIHVAENDVGVWNGHLENMRREHQIIYVECKISRPTSIADSVSYEYDQEMIISSYQHNSDGGKGSHVDFEINHVKKIHCPAYQTGDLEGHCDPISVFSVHFVEYENYYLKVQFIHPFDELKQFWPEVSFVSTLLFSYSSVTFV